ncbi:hypothetical protein OSTOST_14644 [Ostertagia ostertagi]
MSRTGARNRLDAALDRGTRRRRQECASYFSNALGDIRMSNSGVTGAFWEAMNRRLARYHGLLWKIDSMRHWIARPLANDGNPRPTE